MGATVLNVAKTISGFWAGFPLMRTVCWAGSELRKARTWDRTTDVIKLLIAIETIIGTIKKSTLFTGKLVRWVMLVAPAAGSDFMYLAQLTIRNGSDTIAIAAIALLA